MSAEERKRLKKAIAAHGGFQPTADAWGSSPTTLGAIVDGYQPVKPKYLANVRAHLEAFEARTFMNRRSE